MHLDLLKRPTIWNAGSTREHFEYVLEVDQSPSVSLTRRAWPHVPWLPVVTAADQYYGHLHESCMASHHSMITGRELELVLPVSSIDMNSAFWEIPWHFCNTRVRTKKLICDHLTAIFQYIGMAVMPIKQTENKTCQHQDSDRVSTS